MSKQPEIQTTSWELYQEWFPDEYGMYMYFAINLKIPSSAMSSFHDMWLNKYTLFFLIEAKIGLNRSWKEEPSAVWRRSYYNHKEDRFMNMDITKKGDAFNLVIQSKDHSLRSYWWWSDDILVDRGNYNYTMEMKDFICEMIHKISS